MSIYKISKLQVKNFRNLDEQIFNFGDGINCILGENGNGKTNVLEAIHVLSTKKSFRKNASFPQFLSIDGGKPEIIFSSLIHNEDGENVSYSAKFTNESAFWSVNGNPVKKRLDIKIVFINPFDSYGFHNNPSDRREWVDYFISNIDEQYKKNLKKYQQALKFRNTLLQKKPTKFKDQITANDYELSKLSEQLITRRLKFINEISHFMSETYKSLFSEVHYLEMRLESKFIGMNIEQIFNRLQNNLETDAERGSTSEGPHRDDYVLLFDGLNSFDFCSLGQQKMSYLSLLFAYIELFRYKYSLHYPIVLIDDVSGELDQHRWRRLVEYLEKRQFQVMITTANEKFKEELDRINGAHKIYIKNGSIAN